MGEHEKATGGPGVIEKVQGAAKAIVALGGAGLTTALVTVLPDDVAPWVGLVMAALTGVATFQVTNRKPPEDISTAGYPDVLKTEPSDALG